MSDDLFEIEKRIRSFTGMVAIPEADAYWRRRIPEELRDMIEIDLRPITQPTYIRHGGETHLMASAVVLSGPELRRILQALGEETRKAADLREQIATLRRERDEARAILRDAWPFFEEDDHDMATPKYQAVIDRARPYGTTPTPGAQA